LFGAVILYLPAFANVLIPLEVSMIKRIKKKKTNKNQAKIQRTKVT